MPGKKKKNTPVKIKNNNQKNGNVLGLPKSELDKYQGMTVPQIQKRYEEVLKKPAKSTNRAILIKSIWKFQLEKKAVQNKSALTKAVPGKSSNSPSVKSGKSTGSVAGSDQKVQTAKGQKVPEKSTGLSGIGEAKAPAKQLPTSATKTVQAGAEKPLEKPKQNNEEKTVSATIEKKAVAKRDPRLPEPGTVLRREYAGKLHEVKVLDEGCDYKGKRFRSLSGVAKHITASSWNGYVFWGLSKSARNNKVDNH